ncbi:uncharacterized protein LOC143036494 [Oratosquilla oratoria]|uniref:uncharacterized protein LOC143036494 n=1 Tax=Oratosquilla oratoria TaxID=337810 RepID=UPI003F761701
MARRKTPVSLSWSSLEAWLQHLENQASRAGGLAPLHAPPALLGKALLHHAGLRVREATLVRLVRAAVAAGVGCITLESEVLHPGLREALVEALASRPEQLTTLALTMDPRAGASNVGESLGKAMEGMTSLTSFTLSCGATDLHIESLARASPPLRHLDVSYSPGVTDAGVRALLLAQPDHTMRLNQVGETTTSAAHLQTMNVWGTNVTTRGCLVILRSCRQLHSLTCQWAAEAVEVMSRAQTKSPELLTLKQLLMAESDPDRSAPRLSALCPELATLVVRRPTAHVDVTSLLSALPKLTSLTILQFTTPPSPVAPPPQLSSSLRPSLTHLHLAFLGMQELDLVGVAAAFPCLNLLHLEGVLPSLRSLPLHRDQEGELLSKLVTLKLTTPYTLSHSLDVAVIMWSLKRAKQAVHVDLGSCSNLLDNDLIALIDNGALQLVEELKFSGARQLTDEIIVALVERCPSLRRLALKLLPKDRLAQLETLKTKFRQLNLDIDLITFGWKC